jgi:hypothetical protein
MDGSGEATLPLHEQTSNEAAQTPRMAARSWSPLAPPVPGSLLLLM